MPSSKKRILPLSISPYVVWILKNVNDFSFRFCQYDLLTPFLYFSSDIASPPTNSSTLYDLIANVTHESVAGTTRDKENTVWKAHIRAGGGGGDNEKWFMIQDLIVEETRKEMIFLGETILQVTTFMNDRV